MNYILVIYPYNNNNNNNKKKKKEESTPTLIHVQTLNIKKVGKKNLLPHTKSYHFCIEFTILISFISLRTSSPISLLLFFSIIIFGLLFTTLFLWNTTMNTTNFTNWRIIKHKKVHSNIYLLYCLSIIHSCHISLWAFYSRIFVHNILTTLYNKS